MKISDLDNNEKKQLEEQLDTVSSTMGMDSWDAQGANQNLLKDQIGMCYNCKNLHYCKSEFGDVFAKCNIFEFKLNGQNRITECNLHVPKHVLSLTEMYSMAHLIDTKDPKVHGFISQDKKFKK